MATNQDILIVGAGPIGASCARALAAAGAAVTVIQPTTVPGEGWRASAGMLAAQVEARLDDPLLELSVAGRNYFRQSTAELRANTGIDIGLLECGILHVLHLESEVEDIKERVAWQRQQAHRADWLSAADVAERWPWLARSVGALWSPEDGAVDPEQLVLALRADATRLGVRFITDTVRGLHSEDGRVHGVIGQQRPYAANTVVIAAGAWSGRLRGLPRPLSVEPVRGQMMAFPWPSGAAPAIVYGDRCYLLPRNGEMLVGATVEHAGFNSDVDPRSLAELQQRAARVYPALATAEPLRSWAGLRPGTPDGLPVIGPEPRLSGLWYATGHGRNGILLSGITGEVIAREIAGDTVDIDLQAFRPGRFWNW